MNYRKVNNLVGWITGAIASIVYLKTMEPTVSFWDCGEFLSCAYKLEVGHSPGAPFFMMLQRIFGIFAGGASGGPSTNAAVMINSLSALMSGGTILFLFWTITHLAKKLVAPGDGEPSQNQLILIMGAGLVGGLAYTFSDTFWFSAVEAEVYATSSFFTALVFWAILKWENIANNKYADRWLIFISYMIGLSVGVHLLNLLTIPAIAMVYYFKRYDATRMGTVIAFLAGVILLAFVQFGVIQYLPIFASKFDLLFVNSFGMPFDVGALVAILLVVGALIWLLMFAKKKGWYLLHTGVLCIMFIVIGFSSYLAPMIRSRADVAIDMTNPDNVLSLVSYVQREQYGAQPLLYGQDFDAKMVDVETKGYTYSKTTKNGKDYYEQTGKKLDYKFEPDKMRFFPRIYDNNDQGHVRFYRNYLGLGPDDRPSSADNMKYFFGYQMGWMWWRYVMWNYAGRENDVEGQGDPRNGNWISGIKFLDKMRVGDLDLAGDGVKNNPARNELYFLPLILGLLGLVYQFNKDKKDGIVTFMLFFFTGIAIGIYLNMPPLQPRERDYAFAGSTYAFAIWIGLGILMVNQWLQKVVKGNGGSILAVVLCLVAVPCLMAKEEWNDHDRSKKYLARTTAINVLNSCAPNAVLFTFGDNDTYPVWYAQEVEGVRPDVRIINMSLLGIDWYIDQLNYKINKADALPMIWKKPDYQGDNHNYVFHYANPNIPQDKYINLGDICKFIISNDDGNKLQTQNGGYDNYMPTKNFFLTTPSKDQLVRDGLVSAADTARITNEVKFTFPKNAAYKDDIAVMNIIAAMASDGWKRPIYFGGGLPGDNYAGLDEYLKLEGVVYRLMPYKYTDVIKQNRGGEKGFVDVDKSFNLFMNVYQWGNSDRSDVYFDEKNRLMFQAYRINASLRLADELNASGRKDDAIKVLDKVDKSLSQAAYPYNPYTLEGFDASGYFYAMTYYQVGEKGIPGGRKVSHELVKNLEGDINWILSLNDEGREALTQDAQKDLGMIHSIGQLAGQAGDSTTAKEMDMKVKGLEQKMASGLNLQAQR